MKDSISFILRIAIVAALFLDGGSKIDSSINVELMPLADYGAPEWATFVFGLFELGLGLLTFFGALPFYLSLGVTGLMLAYTGLLQSTGALSISGLSLDHFLTTFKFGLSSNPMSTSLVVATLALIYGLMSKAKQQEMIAKRKEKRAAKKMTTTQTAAS